MEGSDEGLTIVILCFSSENQAFRIRWGERFSAKWDEGCNARMSNDFVPLQSGKHDTTGTEMLGIMKFLCKSPIFP